MKMKPDRERADGGNDDDDEDEPGGGGQERIKWRSAAAVRKEDKLQGALRLLN